MKKIAAFRAEPYGLFIDLDDQIAAIGVNTKSGDILLDEGSGPDRYDGAAIGLKAAPAFSVVPSGEGEVHVKLGYGDPRRTHDLGVTQNYSEAVRWTINANRTILICSLAAQLSALERSLESEAQSLYAGIRSWIDAGSVELRLALKGDVLPWLHTNQPPHLRIDTQSHLRVLDLDGIEEQSHGSTADEWRPANLFECRVIVCRNQSGPSGSVSLREQWSAENFMKYEMIGLQKSVWGVKDQFAEGLTVTLHAEYRIRPGTLFSILQEDQPVCAGVVSRIL